MKRLSQEELDKILSQPGKVDISSCDVSKLSMAGTNMEGANMEGANMGGANMRGANMGGANMRGTNMEGAYMEGAYMVGANMGGANMRGANMRGANMEGANMAGAYMADANMVGANMRGTNMEGAYMVGAYMAGALLPHFQIPQEGPLIGWKKLRSGHLCKLRVSGKRTSTLVGRKCRAKKAKVLAIHTSDGATLPNGSSVGGLRDPSFLYTVGEWVHEPEYDDDIRIECTKGIHFFLTREEAEEW